MDARLRIFMGHVFDCSCRSWSVLAALHVASMTAYCAKSQLCQCLIRHGETPSRMATGVARTRLINEQHGLDDCSLSWFGFADNRSSVAAKRLLHDHPQCR